MILESDLVAGMTSLVHNFYLLFFFIAIGFAAIIWAQYQSDRELKEALATVLASDKGLTKKVKKFTDKEKEVKQ